MFSYFFAGITTSTSQPAFLQISRSLRVIDFDFIREHKVIDNELHG